VTAITSSESKQDYLHDLGANDIVVSKDGNFHKHPTLKAGVRAVVLDNIYLFFLFYLACAG